MQAKNLREKMESMWIWQEATSQTMKDIKDQSVQQTEDIRLVEERFTLMRSEIDSKVKAEAEIREQQIDELKNKENDDEKKTDVESEVTKEELETCQKGIRKLAESIQTVKTVLGMKIQSEQKLVSRLCTSFSCFNLLMSFNI